MAEPAETMVYEGFSARARLGIMGISLDDMIEVVRRGEVARAQFTAFDPLNAGGIDAYRFRVRGLREIHHPLGWKVSRLNGLELLESPDGQISILTRAGTSDVGNPSKWADPQPAGEIGGGTRAVLEQTSLFDLEWLLPRGVKPPGRQTWMLLVFESPTVIRSELSWGAEAVDGRIPFWFERVILPDLDPNDLTPKQYPTEEPDAGAIDVPVVRKK
jgi:hypothetical protein